MPEIKELGTVIASREMEFIFDDGRKEKAYLKVGMPLSTTRISIGAAPTN